MIRHRRVEHEFAVLVTDARSGDRAEERNAGNRQRRRTADHRDDIGIVFQIVAENGRDHLRFAEITFGEQRADRTVDQDG